MIHSAKTKTRSSQEMLLAAAGATRVDRIQGRLAATMTSFPAGQAPEATLSEAEIRHVCQMQYRNALQDVPLAHLTALQFAYHDIFCPFEFTAMLPGEFAADLPSVAPGTLANRHLGQLQLGSVYGRNGLTGDFAQQMQGCMRSPWDSAKLWSLPNGSERQNTRDVLRLFRVIAGDGAMLDEAFFEQLPPWLREDYFLNGELRLNFPVTPEPRNDENLLLSQFHAAVVAFHNRTVDTLDAHNRSDAKRSDIFNRAHAFTARAFRMLLLLETLPRICSLAQVEWAWTHLLQINGLSKGPRTTSIEGIVVMETLLAALRPATISPDASDLRLTYDEFNSPGGHFCLPNTLFVSARIPTRLAEESHLDWRSFVGSATSQPQTLRQAGQDLRCINHAAQRLDAALKLARHSGLASGQACARLIQDHYELDFPILSPADVQNALGLPDAPGENQMATPLPLYVLAEAEALGEDGTLGPLGAHILADMMIGAAIGNMQESEVQDMTQRLATQQDQDTCLTAFLGLNGAPSPT